MKTGLEDFRQAEAILMCKTYGRYPVAVSHGKGSRLWDYSGKEYVDLLGGIAVTGLGHAHPEITQVITDQAHKLIHVGNLFFQKEQLDLARRILAGSHFGKAFFCNSGAEANEAAVKLARRYMQRVKKRDAFEIITFEGCFHGRTLATVSASGRAALQDGFSPMPQGFTTIAWNDLDLLAATITPQTAGVFIEVIQGEGGVRPATGAFIQGIERICREKDILFIVDEIQTGLGRTGKLWSYQHFGVTPDVITSAKALANGLPIGAMLAVDAVAAGFDTGSHGSTFGGGALVTRVAEKVLEIMERDKLPQHAGELGAWAQERFRAVGKACPGKIAEVRGMGLMIGIELTFPGKEVWNALIEAGFIVNLTQEKVLRLLPALNIEKADLEHFAVALENILQQV